MKLTLIFILLLSVAACGENSSPEGRMTVKIDAIKKEIDSLKKQNVIILDSLQKMNADLRRLQTDK